MQTEKYPKFLTMEKTNFRQFVEKLFITLCNGISLDYKLY